MNGKDANVKCKKAYYGPSKLHYSILDVESVGKIKRIGKDDFKILKMVGKGSYGKVFLVEKMIAEFSPTNQNLDESMSIVNSATASPFYFEQQTVVSGSGSLYQASGKYFAMKVMKKDLLKKENKVEAIMGK
jgi:serine/threonine protein kinase